LFLYDSQILDSNSIALGEMSHAKDLLTLLLSPTILNSLTSERTTSPATLTATTVTKPSPIPSVQAFNSQISMGGKDQALRKAADLFKSAAESMERGRVKGEKYWVDALKIRRGNWGLIPAPLPFGSATGKGADKTSKDLLISFGMEECAYNFQPKFLFYFLKNRSQLLPYFVKEPLGIWRLMPQRLLLLSSLTASARACAFLLVLQKLAGFNIWLVIHSMFRTTTLWTGPFERPNRRWWSKRYSPCLSKKRAVYQQHLPGFLNDLLSSMLHRVWNYALSW
jgi:hypothetical protein